MFRDSESEEGWSASYSVVAKISSEEGRKEKRVDGETSSAKEWSEQLQSRVSQADNIIVDDCVQIVRFVGVGQRDDRSEGLKVWRQRAS
jgi:hypothetical protein